MILRPEPKRLLIYSFYDKSGIIDRYVTMVIKDLKRNVSRTVFVSNGKLADKQSEKLEGIVDKILERENEGPDVWAYKQALEGEGFDSLSQYDEVILMNSSLMGPVESTDRMFSDMSSKDLDFWGLSKFHEVEEAQANAFSGRNNSEYIQPHFIVARKGLLSSEYFEKYWRNMPDIETQVDSARTYETGFTERFRKLGFKYDVYVNTDSIAAYSNSPINYMPVEMIKEYHCPYFKKELFFDSYNKVLEFTTGQIASDLMEYLKSNTKYDTNLIWDNILRCYDMIDIKNCLSLNYILPSDRRNDSGDAGHKKVALIYHSHFPELIDDTVRYVNNMPEYADIYITANTDENIALLKERFKNHKFNKLEIIPKINRGRDVSSMLVAAKDFIMDYDFVCAAHDKKVKHVKPLTVGQGFAYICLENVLGTENYVHNIIDLFEKNPRLGLLTPPPPINGTYFAGAGAGWGPNFEIAYVLAKKLGLHVPMSEEHDPIAPIGSTFWFRPAGMKKMFAADWKYDDFPEEPIRDDGTILHAIERLHGFIEQDAGYYCAWGMTDYSSSVYMTALNYMLRGYARNSFQNGIRGDYAYMVAMDEAALKAYSGIAQAISSCTKGALAGVVGVGEVQSARMYFDTGNGLSEDDVVIEKIHCDGKLNIIDYKFTVPANIIRFDPTENKTLMLKDLTMIARYKDGSTKEIPLSDCTANGRRFGKNNYVFIDGDPQIKYASKGRNIVGVLVKCSVNTNVDFEEYAEIVRWYDQTWYCGITGFKRRLWNKIKSVLRPVKNLLVRKNG